MNETLALERLADRIIEPGRVTTWLNHWSLMHADWCALAETDLIGFDGTLLGMVLARHGHPVVRTSADLTLPLVLRGRLDPSDRIVFIGAAQGVAERAAARFPDHDITVFDGYQGLLALSKDPSALVDVDPRLVVVALGAGRQEEWASRVHDLLPRASVCTAGGWLDQLADREQYFPPWVHRARLGWALRILREPRRLTGRYTVEAATFARVAPQLVRRLEALGEFRDDTLVVTRPA